MEAPIQTIVNNWQLQKKNCTKKLKNKIKSYIKGEIEYLTVYMPIVSHVVLGFMLKEIEKINALRDIFKLNCINQIIKKDLFSFKAKKQ